MKKRKKLPWQQMVITGIGLVVLIPMVKQYIGLRCQCINEKKEIERLQKENEYYSELLKEVNHPYLVEKLAREQFGLMKEGEYLFRVKDKNKGKNVSR